MKKYATASLLFSFFIITVTVFGQSKAVTIDTMIHRTNRLGLFSGNILVVDGGKVVYRNAMGFTDASKTEKLTDQYRFHIGSIAKEFNAVGIMMLQEQGKLNIDDKLSKFFPELPAWANKVSIKNLLQYTSGIPDVKWKTVKSDADNMADLMKLEQLDFEPGTKYAYNNNNVFMQRRIIEKITGMLFNNFVEEKLLKPAGMSTAVIDPDDNKPLMAKSYTNAGKQGPLVYPITGWVAVTLDDFYKWEQALENFKLISPASTKILVAPFGLDNQCGLGGGSMAGNKLVFHKHDGSSVYYQALVVGSPLKGRTVILMTNNRQNNIFDIDNAIQNILDGKPYGQPKHSILADFQKQLDTLSGPGVLAFYRDLKGKHPNDYGFENEVTLNEIGYFLMNAKKLDAAIMVFEYNTTLFPTSSNVFDSLGEAYFNKGDKAKALLNYKRSLKLDATNGAAKAIIAELEK
ncbi:serine hydrolase domain-containing protein [Mucilaginibacter gilvus]|uniref:Serine hydrolase n=1 Tax=Mucilaginibacter gilvus TaxID=2305909 RepID=A0A444MV60_9SPHI|nr:serine hydrolase domain-containing protein [Mucilaginibacter gilvus]RWY57445.1 serine hydrolase [Mucilaginibacter gilvus]